ncbi:ZIP family metal transporter [Haloarchaeobius sp. HRN-SO-5]|uniref:ZIP family metal transporter n=1 Tax=Haloarchaeobius sp. HRN-SO-5 TaxID=3446118 RepID=UPI003EBDE702
MAQELLYVYGSVAVVSLLALVGIVTVAMGRQKLDRVLPYLVSFSAGTLLGDAFLHLIPEVVATHGFDAGTGLVVLSGIVLAFVLEKYISWHHNHYPNADQAQPLSYMILFGDSIHNALDGVIIAASYLASIPLGLATTAAIATHEIPQEIGDFGVLVYGGMPHGRAVAYNFLTALTAFVGATAVLLLAEYSGALTHYLLPVAAGNFVYIAASDLLPELVDETDVYRSTVQLVTFLGGIAVLGMVAL